MAFISEELVIAAIDEISKISYTGTPYKNEKDLLSYYLLLSKLRIDKYTPQTIKSIFQNSDLVNQTLYELSGMFNPDENIKKKGSLFFTTFYHKVNKDGITGKSFYNPGTVFSSLKGRLADTIDNSISDYMLKPRIKDGESYYVFLNNVEEIVARQYKDKFLLSSVLIWIYRTRDFIYEVNFNELYQLFLSEYNISAESINILFKNDYKELNYEKTCIDAVRIRTILDIVSEVEIVGEPQDQTILDIQVINKNDIINITGATMNSTTLSNLVEKYHQIIITGVPGTGKSYLVEELSASYTVKKVQFHQNYTYQTFMLGKTIKDGNVSYERGVFLDFLINTVKEGGDEKYLFIIDEINRGNTSSIFGELLHALDRDKPILLPNGDMLTLPNNLFIVGTMNSADRSIALVDYAIRRRFMFVELEPDYNLLDRLSTINGEQKLGTFLRIINSSIERVLKNRDFRLGHSYLIKDGTSNFDNNDIFELIHYKIMPMLYEYAQGDFSIVGQILSTEITQSTPTTIFTAIDNYISNEQN